MATFTRANAWNHGGTFDNPDLLWYAKGVGAMQAKRLNETGSWWFFAAMHGEYVQVTRFPGWGFIPGLPKVPATPRPSSQLVNTYWDQCQHQSWYFLPWHRGYLMALEQHLRAEIVNLKGPSTWALPYWNYFGSGGEFKMPPAFAHQKLPDGSANPLFVTARYGPDNNGNIFVPTRTAVQKQVNLRSAGDGVTEDALLNNLFTGDDDKTPPPGFGGPDTGFSHGGEASGNIENDPHNLVHVYVGGSRGLMSDPGTAALDPIFYLHHANIDRMWSRWNANTANRNPKDSQWLDGPASQGERPFVMPRPDGSSWTFTPRDMTDRGQVNYSYDDMSPAPTPPVSPRLERLTRLGVRNPSDLPEASGTPSGEGMELVGANDKPLPIKGPRVETNVRLDSDVRLKISRSLAAPSPASVPDRVYLALERVRGTHDGSVLNVYINLPEGAMPMDHPELLAGSVGLFGLRRASDRDSTHAGRGLSFTLEISRIVDTLHLTNALQSDSIAVTVVPRHPVPDDESVTVGRVSVYRQGG
jgi:tyrosinase